MRLLSNVELARERPLGDTRLQPAFLDGLDHAAVGIDLAHHALHLPFHLVGEKLDQVAAAQRVDGVRDSALVGDELLRAQRELGREFGRQLQRLVERGREDRLGASQDGGHGFDCHADDVVVGLRCGERGPAADDAEAEMQRLLVVDTVALAEQPRPQPARRPELADLLEEIHVDVEEETQALGEFLERRRRGR